MRSHRRLFCLLLIFCLLPFGLLSAAPADEPAPTVRVLLRRLALTDRVDLYLNGDYTVTSKSGLSALFPSGSHVTVLVRQDELYLFFRDMTLKAGKDCNWIRSDASGKDAPGLRFTENGNLYPGDLQLTVSGGQLQPVLTLSAEDYLLGVLPYEMSESFPLEALKAQAVCARTYVLSHVDPSRSYDVVDTTNDQVFKGIDSSLTRCAEAVRSTAGIVVTWIGKLAVCYFAASNGGQTELLSHAWPGAADMGCYIIKDDPYDIENPQSLIRSHTIPKVGDKLHSSLREAILTASAGQLADLGFRNDPDMFRIDKVTGVSLQTPRYSSPSRLMTELSLTFDFSVRTLIPVETPIPPVGEDDDLLLFATPDPDSVVSAVPTPTPVLSDWLPAAQSLTVALPIFPDLIRALNLSVYGADNEILNVKETGDAFVLTAGRYGHGVGMSQRGAEWMADHYKKTFTEILEFYFPGTELKQVAFGKAPIPTPDPILAETPGPAATPTPRPTLMPVTSDRLPEGAWLASVEGIEDDSSLNLRSEPSPIADVIMRVYKHQQFLVLETCEDPEWVHVKTDALEGYVMVKFLEKVQ